MRYLTISYDFAGTAVHDRARMEDKLKRDQYEDGDSFLTVAWSTRRETVRLSARATVEALPAFAGRIRPLYDLLSVVAAPYIAWMRGERPDAIIVQEFPLLWAAYATHLVVGGEVVLRLTNLSGELAHTRGRANRWYHRFHEIFAKRLASRYIVINETTKIYLTKLGIPRSQIRLSVPDTIMRDAEHVRSARPGHIRATYGITADMPILLSVGRLEKEKGYDELLELFAAAKMHAKLIIVGEGSLRPLLEQKIRELGIAGSVILAGWQDRAHIWDFYADADAFVLLSRSEALGLVFWEAMYMRVPVIGRPIGGIPETIGKDGERGFLWGTKDGSEAFKERLERSIHKAADIQAMIERARAFVEEKITTP